MKSRSWSLSLSSSKLVSKSLSPFMGQSPPSSVGNIVHIGYTRDSGKACTIFVLSSWKSLVLSSVILFFFLKGLPSRVRDTWTPWPSEEKERTSCLLVGMRYKDGQLNETFCDSHTVTSFGVRLLGHNIDSYLSCHGVRVVTVSREPDRREN